MDNKIGLSFGEMYTISLHIHTIKNNDSPLTLKIRAIKILFLIKNINNNICIYWEAFYHLKSHFILLQSLQIRYYMPTFEMKNPEEVKWLAYGYSASVRVRLKSGPGLFL